MRDDKGIRNGRFSYRVHRSQRTDNGKSVEAAIARECMAKMHDVRKDLRSREVLLPITRRTRKRGETLFALQQGLILPPEFFRFV